MREQIRLDNRWQTRQRGERGASVFVPSPWSEKRVMLQSSAAQGWSGATLAGEQLKRGDAGEWLSESVKAGTWNTIEVEGGTTDGARLVASERLHIQSLQVTSSSERSVSARVRLSEGAQGLVTVVLSLTAPDGRQVGGTEVMLGRKAREFSVEIPLTGARAGEYRLKATLIDGDHVVDNARIETKIR